MNDLQKQLAPGWSAVNIALTVILFIIGWPLGLLMVAYVLLGDRLDIDLSRPHTVSIFGRRVRRSAGAAIDAWDDPLPTGTPSSTGTPASTGTPIDALHSERARLDAEREAFESEKRAWEAGQREKGTRENVELN